MRRERSCLELGGRGHGAALVRVPPRTTDACLGYWANYRVPYDSALLRTVWDAGGFWFDAVASNNDLASLMVD